MEKHLTEEFISPLETLVPVALEQNPEIIPTHVENVGLNLAYLMEGIIWDRGPLKMFKRRSIMLGTGLKRTLEKGTKHPYLVRQMNDGSNEQPNYGCVFVPGIKLDSVALYYPGQGNLNLFVFYRERSIPVQEYDSWLKETLENTNLRQQGTNWEQFPTDLRTIRTRLYLEESTF